MGRQGCETRSGWDLLERVNPFLLSFLFGLVRIREQLLRVKSMEGKNKKLVQRNKRRLEVFRLQCTASFCKMNMQELQ